MLALAPLVVSGPIPERDCSGILGGAAGALAGGTIGGVGATAALIGGVVLPGMRPASA
jgi:hypothetical protein